MREPQVHVHQDDNYVCVGGNKHHINCFLCSACFKPRFHELQASPSCLDSVVVRSPTILSLVPPQYGKIVCHECLPKCDGCGLPLIPANGKNAKRSNTGQPSQPAETSAGSNGNESKDVEEDGEVIIERDGSVQRYHRKCVLKCASCSRPIWRKRGKLYKKQVPIPVVMIRTSIAILLPREVLCVGQTLVRAMHIKVQRL